MLGAISFGTVFVQDLVFIYCGFVVCVVLVFGAVGVEFVLVILGFLDGVIEVVRVGYEFYCVWV